MQFIFSSLESKKIAKFVLTISQSFHASQVRALP